MKKRDSPGFSRGQWVWTFERRSVRATDYRAKKPKPKPFRNLTTGEIVMRRRGGRGFERVYEPWSPEGLVRKRSLLVWEPNPKVSADRGPDEGWPIKLFAGRGKEWVSYPRGWAAEEPAPGPYVVRAAAELALHGADVSGWNIPGAAEFAARNLEANRRASDDVGSIGPRLDERPEREHRLPFISIHGEVTWQSVPINLSPESARYRAELRERERFRDAAGGRVVTNDFKGDNRERGAVVTILRNGQVRLGKHGVWTRWHQGADGGVPHRGATAVHGVRDYTSKRQLLFKSGKRRKVLRQQSPETNKPGRKPIGLIAMTSAERVRKHRRAKQLRALVAPERHQTGAGQPLPRGRPAPVNLLRKEKK